MGELTQDELAVRDVFRVLHQRTMHSSNMARAVVSHDAMPPLLRIALVQKGYQGNARRVGTVR